MGDVCRGLQVAVIEGLSYNKLVEKLLDFRSLAGGAKDSGKPSLDAAADDGDVAEISSSQPAQPADVETKTEAENIEAGEEVAEEVGGGEEGARDSTSSPDPSEGASSMPVEGHDEGMYLEAAESSLVASKSANQNDPLPRILFIIPSPKHIFL